MSKIKSILAFVALMLCGGAWADTLAKWYGDIAVGSTKGGFTVSAGTGCTIANDVAKTTAQDGGQAYTGLLISRPTDDPYTGNELTIIVKYSNYSSCTHNNALISAKWGSESDEVLLATTKSQVFVHSGSALNKVNYTFPDSGVMALSMSSTAGVKMLFLDPTTGKFVNKGQYSNVKKGTTFRSFMIGGTPQAIGMYHRPGMTIEAVAIVNEALVGDSVYDFGSQDKYFTYQYANINDWQATDVKVADAEKEAYLKSLAYETVITGMMGGGSVNYNVPLPAVGRYATYHSDGVVTFELQLQEGSWAKSVMVGAKVEAGCLKLKALACACKNATTTDSQITYNNGTTSVVSGFSSSTLADSNTTSAYGAAALKFVRAKQLNKTVAEPSFFATTAPKFRLDASAYGNFEFDENGNVTKWKDLATDPHDATPAQAKAGNANVIKNGRVEVVNGVPAFQMGDAGSGIDLGYSRQTFQTVFWVMDIKNSAGAFFLGDTNGGSNNSYDCHRGDNGQYANSIHGKLKDAAIRCNGTSVTATSDVPPSGLRVYSAVFNQTAGSDRLTQDRDINNRNGGRAISELMLFDGALTDEQVAEVNNYLMTKWLGNVITVTGDADWPSEIISGAVTIFAQGNGTLTIGQNIDLERVTVLGSGNVALTAGNGVAASTSSIDASGATGTLAFDCLAAGSAVAGTDLSLKSCSAATIGANKKLTVPAKPTTISFANNTSVLKITGDIAEFPSRTANTTGTYALAGSFTGDSISVGPSSNNNTTHYYTIEDGFAAEVSSIRLGQGQTHTVNITQNGGSLTSTGTAAWNQEQNYFQFGHWRGTTTYNMLGGTATSLSCALTSWDGGLNLSIGGGSATPVMKVKGVASNKNTNAINIYLKPNGTLDVGEIGFEYAHNNRKLYMQGGTLSFYHTAETSVKIAGGIEFSNNTASEISNDSAVKITSETALSGAGSFTKKGTGELKIEGSFSGFSGAMTVTAGKLSLPSTCSNSITVQDGTTLKLVLTPSQNAAGYTAENVTLQGSGVVEFWTEGASGLEKIDDSRVHGTTVDALATVYEAEVSGSVNLSAINNWTCQGSEVGERVLTESDTARVTLANDAVLTIDQNTAAFSLTISGSGSIKIAENVAVSIHEGLDATGLDVTLEAGSTAMIAHAAKLTVKGSGATSAQAKLKSSDAITDIEGTGLVELNGISPYALADAVRTSLKVSAKWTGTVWVHNYNFEVEDTNAKRFFSGNEYGNINSRVRLSGVTSWNESSGSYVVTVPIELMNDDADFALKITNGSSGNSIDINHLCGTGLLWGASGGATTVPIVIKEWAGFTGGVKMEAKVAVFGERSNIPASKTAGTIFVAEGKTVTQAANTTWSGTFLGSGMVVADGRAPGGTFTNTGWTGTVWVKNVQNPTLANFGNAGSKIKLTGVSHGAPNAFSITGEIELSDDGETKAYTFDSWNNNNQTFNIATLTGNGTYAQRGFSWYGAPSKLMIGNAEDFRGGMIFTQPSDASQQKGGMWIVVGDTSPTLPGSDAHWHGRVYVQSGYTLGIGKSINSVTDNNYIAGILKVWSDQAELMSSEFAEGSTIDLSEVGSMLTLPATATGTTTVKVGDRTIEIGDKLISWSAKPENLTLALDKDELYLKQTDGGAVVAAYAAKIVNGDNVAYYETVQAAITAVGPQGDITTIQIIGSPTIPYGHCVVEGHLAHALVATVIDESSYAFYADLSSAITGLGDNAGGIILLDDVEVTGDPIVFTANNNAHRYIDLGNCSITRTSGEGPAIRVANGGYLQIVSFDYDEQNNPIAGEGSVVNEGGVAIENIGTLEIGSCGITGSVDTVTAGASVWGLTWIHEEFQPTSIVRFNHVVTTADIAQGGGAAILKADANTNANISIDDALSKAIEVAGKNYVRTCVPVGGQEQTYHGPRVAPLAQFATISFSAPNATISGQVNIYTVDEMSVVYVGETYKVKFAVTPDSLYRVTSVTVNGDDSRATLVDGKYNLVVTEDDVALNVVVTTEAVPAVARVGETEYADITSAINAAKPTHADVVLLQDLTMSTESQVTDCYLVVPHGITLTASADIVNYNNGNSGLKLYGKLVMTNNAHLSFRSNIIEFYAGSELYCESDAANNYQGAISFEPGHNVMVKAVDGNNKVAINGVAMVRGDINIEVADGVEIEFAGKLIGQTWDSRAGKLIKIGNGKMTITQGAWSDHSSRISYQLNAGTISSPLSLAIASGVSGKVVGASKVGSTYTYELWDATNPPAPIVVPEGETVVQLLPGQTATYSGATAPETVKIVVPNVSGSGSFDITEYFTITKENGTITATLKDDATTKPTVSSMAMPNEAVALTITPIPGLFYSIVTCGTVGGTYEKPDGVAAVQASGTGSLQLTTPLPSDRVKFFKVRVSATK